MRRVSVDLVRILRSFAVTIDEMETDPDYVSGKDLHPRSIEGYIGNLKADAQGIKSLDSLGGGKGAS